MDGKFHDIIKLREVEEKIIQEMAGTAAKLGIDVLIFSHEFKTEKEISSLKEILLKIQKNSNVELKIGSIITEEKVPNLVKKINTLRNSSDVILVEGGNLEINKKACEMSEVDILIHPDRDRKDSGLDQVLVQKASENNVAMGFDFNRVVERQVWERIQLIHHMENNLSLCLKYKAPFICFTNSRNKWEMRSPRDICSLLTILGLDITDSIRSVTEFPSNIVKRSEEVKLSSFIRPGIRRA